VIYYFMFQHKEEHAIARMARILSVSESGYYKWLRRRNAPLTVREQEELNLTEEIYSIFKASHYSYGSRKITAILNQRHTEPINHKRVERIMQKYCWHSKVRRKYIVTTDSDHDFPIAPNLLKRDFSTDGPGQKMVSDTTAIPTGEGTLYVAGILDLYGRRPVGIALSMHNDRFLVLDALEDMILRGFKHTGAILHSDRGSTYCSREYRQAIEDAGMICSMSRKGDCWDNAPMECFWGKMKSEWMDRDYETIAEAAADVYEYCWSFYSKQRIHASLNYTTPERYYNSWTHQPRYSMI
jgi:putative transposase